MSPIRTTWMYFPYRIIFWAVVLAAANIISICFFVYRKIKGKELLLRILFLNYCYILLFFTVLGRRSKDDYRYDLNFLDSYKIAFVDGDQNMQWQIIANIGAFIPIGLFSSFLLRSGKKRYCGIPCGIVFSCSIEIMQFTLGKGFFELDDILSNTIGAIIGTLIASILFVIRNRYSNHETTHNR